MRSFIDKAGKVIDCTTEHRIYCRKVLHKNYRVYLQHNIRAAGFHGCMIIETKQKHITACQLKAVRRLYREYRCFNFYANISDVEIGKINDLKNFLETGG